MKDKNRSHFSNAEKLSAEELEKVSEGSLKDPAEDCIILNQPELCGKLLSIS